MSPEEIKFIYEKIYWHTCSLFHKLLPTSSIRTNNCTKNNSPIFLEIGRRSMFAVRQRSFVEISLETC